MNNIKIFYTALNEDGKNAKAGEIRANLEIDEVTEAAISPPTLVSKISLVQGSSLGEDKDPLVYSYYVKADDQKVPRLLIAKNYPKGLNSETPSESTARYVVYKPISDSSDWVAVNDGGQGADFGYNWSQLTNLRGITQINEHYVFALNLDGTKIYTLPTSALETGTASSGPTELIDLAEFLKAEAGYTLKGVKILAGETQLFVLYSQVADPYDPQKAYADSKLVSIPVDFEDGGKPKAQEPTILDVGKNATDLVAAYDGKPLKLFITCLGGPLTPGVSNGTESKLQVVDFKKKTVTTAFTGLPSDANSPLTRDSKGLNFTALAVNQSGSSLIILTTALDAKGAGVYWRLYKSAVYTVVEKVDATIEDLEASSKLLDYTLDNPDKLGDPGLFWDVFFENAAQRLWLIRGVSIQCTRGPAYPEGPGNAPDASKDRRILTGSALYGSDKININSVEIVSETIYGSTRRQSQGRALIFEAGEGGHPVPALGKGTQAFKNRG
ncbi:MAG: hypothetical protein LBE38_10560 [Deltaproteobacteria bacterium]|jgi:hypothetical protein|nr:hypothetical protein [Deltaproteobacteria bacterium]